MKLNTTPRIADFAGVARELREHASEVNALAEGRLTGTYNAQTSVPTTGLHAKGDIVRNSNPSELGAAPNTYVIYGWICTAGGEPGTWEAMNIPTAVFGGGGGGGSWTEVEIDFGADPVYDAAFTITDAAITSSAVQMVLVPCGKAAAGRTADDWQWDGGTFVANPGTGSATCYATFTPGPIVGKRKLQYQVV